jgi:UDP-glucuronate decarboxylase
VKTFIDPIVKGDSATLQKEISGESFAGKRILIAGGAGFLGSWLCDFLTAANAIVECVDDQSTGMRENIDHLTKKSNFKFQRLDVTQGFDGRYEIILHMASHASPDEYQKRPIESLVVNSHGTRNLLELARKNDAVFFYSSTSEVYGDALVIPTPETYWGNVSSTGPRSCYDEGKRFSEALIMAYHRAYGLDTRMVRIFNTYGPRLRADGLYGRAVSRFISQALAGRDITVHGKGEQTRSFSYVTDTVRALLLTIKEPRMKGQVVNVGNPEESTILELAEKIKMVTQSGSRIRFQPRPMHDPQRRLPNITRAKELLGWSPHVPLDEGLKKTIEWFKSRKYACEGITMMAPLHPTW